MHPEHCFLTMVFVFEQYGTDHIDYSFEEGGGGGGEIPNKKVIFEEKNPGKKMTQETTGKKKRKFFYSCGGGGGGVGKLPIKKIPSRQKLLEKNRPSGAMG